MKWKRCERCGVRVSTKTKFVTEHDDICQRTPLPDELWQRYQDGESAALLARKYDISTPTMVNRIRLVAPLRDYKTIARLRRGRHPIAVDIVDDPRCTRCELLLTDGIDAGGGLCKWCRDEVNGEAVVSHVSYSWPSTWSSVRVEV